MDPAKRASVDARSDARDDVCSETHLEEQVKDWLRYGEDLGLAPYYRDRAPLHAIAEPAAAASSVDSHSTATSSAISAGMPATVPAMAAAAPGRAPAVPINVALQKSPATSAMKTPAAAPTSTILPGSAPSLFEAIERIAGDTLPRIREDIGECTRCRLHKAARRSYSGRQSQSRAGVRRRRPWPRRRHQGEPFVGRAGKLLTQMIEAMGLQREDVYIAT